MKSAKRSYVMTTRAAKTEATRERIRSNALALYCEKPIEDFTLEEVARRAETTVQTVLRAFGSKDDLILAAICESAAQGTPLKPIPPGDIGAAVTVIFDLYETIGDLVIQRLGDERRRPVLKPALDEGRVNHRDWVMDAFARQLAKRHCADRKQLVEILSIATDVYVWKLLRRDRNLERSTAEAVVLRMIMSVTEAENKNGDDSLAQLVGWREPAT